ncbi:MAG: ABC transporter permease [Gammaproteobacteria bacterium]
MMNVLRLAALNLMRYRRRTLLTTLLITLSMVAVLLFISISGSFKALMVGQITDSMLGHVQIHRKGYVASIDNLPLHLNMKQKMVAKVHEVLSEVDGIEAVSERVKLGAMFSNFTETTSIRLNGVNPQQEIVVSPLLPSRLIEGQIDSALVESGHILIPELLARGMKVKPGDTIVLVANNKDGSVNGKTFVVQGVLEGISGPGGRDGYIHIDDARELLRMDSAEVSEIVIRLNNPRQIAEISQQLRKIFGPMKNQQGKSAFEIHSWEKLSPFANIAKMIDLLTLFIKGMLIAVVLISIMNVMIMAVYERIREIGTITAMGTLPNKVLGLFLSEGLLLGVLGSVIGTLISVVVILILNSVQISFDFGRQENLLLTPVIHVMDILLMSGIVVTVSVLASAQPAWKASRMEPIDALRHV